MFRYAVLNNENICVGVSDLYSKVDKSSMLLISDSIYPLGKKLENGEWIEAEQPKIQEELSTSKRVEQLEETVGLIAEQVATQGMLA